MKRIFIFGLLVTGMYGCKKCETCTAYYTSGAINPYIQAVKSCDKTDINAYENSKKPYLAAGGDTIIYKCQ